MSTRLKSGNINALIVEGNLPAVKGGESTANAENAKWIAVGKQGSFISAKERVENLGIGADDKFPVRKTYARITQEPLISFDRLQGISQLAVAIAGLRKLHHLLLIL
jgi:hypothetical protein